MGRVADREAIEAVPALRLAVRGITVRYGATTALDGVDFEAHAGEVQAVVGENGAGKSTLLRVLAGVERPAAGTVESPPAAEIAWVPQEAILPADLTAAEWIFLGREWRRRSRWLRLSAMRHAARTALDRLGCAVEPEARLGSLSAPQRKQVQLARALRGLPGFLLLDEPTAVLGESEAHHLFAIIRDLAARGAGVVYVSHRLDEVMAVADRVTVLRDGRLVSTDEASAADKAVLVRRMVGRDLPERAPAARTRGPVLLRLHNVAAGRAYEFSLAVHGGEIVGLAGLVGAGRSEILEAVARLRPLRAGRIECTARPAILPEDRAGKGLVPALNLRGNLCLPAGRIWIDPRQERDEARRWISRLDIKAGGTEAAIATLSGGNQQKLLLARALRHQPRVLLLDEPTAGVDIGAKAIIHAAIRALAESGTAILLASSDLPELLLLCDLIVAVRNGRAVGTLHAAEATEARLAALITGAET